MKKGLFVSIFLSMVLILAACGGEDSSAVDNTDENTDTESTEAASETGSEVASEATNNVSITLTNFDFDQDQYVVQSGEEVTITLVNEEGNHGISIDELDVNMQGAGEATFIPEEPGEYIIYCNIFCGDGHDEMTATLVVL
ncbi:cupredoxin domain-containing protein [Oceanobacillus saliphilus]|uniref:cupredoxin domain-containing protein n=1 Tax=Oceanobacillus saliphilus TaxID=2925834 RepID=UPI00201DF610|nr:cupredoxin domain-containing protein [Oceanobacillus saliphilus]